MPYPFYCPQHHELQAELTAIGQVAQCPVCGTHFLVPPPDFGAISTRNAERVPGLWQTGGFEANLPVAFAVDPQSASQRFEQPAGTNVPETAPEMPQPTGQLSPAAFGAAADAVFGSIPNTPAATELQPVALPAGTEDESSIELGFDPQAKAALPYELPGQVAPSADESAAGAPARGSPAAVEPPGSFLAGPAPVGPLLPPSLVSAGEIPAADQDNLLVGTPAAQQSPLEAPPPKILRIRCPSGHILKAPSDLLGKLGRCPACKKTFELRYENSLEFQRRTEKIVHREQQEADRTWIAWTFAVVFVAFVALVGAVLILGR